MTGTLITSVTEADLTMSFRSQYVTASLNEKAKAMPRGVIRGFQVVPGSGVDELDLIVDPIQSDSVMNAVGVSNSQIFSLTYRVDTTITLDLSGLTDTGGVRYYLAFVPNYAIGSTTDGEWRAYTEAQFENGDIETDGGVFLCAIELPDVDAIPVLTDILWAGQSGTTGKLFMREDQQDFVQSSGSTKRKLVLDWTPMPMDAQLDETGNSDVFDKTDYIHGRGSIRFASTLNVQIPLRLRERKWSVWTDISDNIRPKVIVQYWYKSLVGQVSSGIGIDVAFFNEAGNSVATASSENSAGRCPTYKTLPTGDSSGWKLLRYEVVVPDEADIANEDCFSAALVIDGTVLTTSDDLFLGPVQVWVEREFTSQGGFGDFGEDIVSDIFVGSGMLIGPSLPGISVSPANQYWRMASTAAGKIQWIPRPVASTSLAEFIIGSAAYGGPFTFILEGDDTTDSFLLLNGLRQVRFNLVSNVLQFRDESGNDDVMIDALALKQTDNYTYNTGNESSVSGDTPDAHTLYSANQVNAWAVFTTDGTGGVDLAKGFNISDISISGTNVEITWDRDFANTDFVVVVQAYAVTDAFALASSKSISGVDIGLRTDAGSTVDLATTAKTFMVMAIGEQA